MASRPFDTDKFTPHELNLSRRAASALWVLSLALLAALAIWSTQPGLVA